MQAHLFAPSRRSYEPDINKLASLLSPDIISSTTLFAIEEVDESVALPRYIAQTTDLTEEQTEELKITFASLSETDIELKFGEAVIEPSSGLEINAENLPASFFGTSDAELLEADAARSSIQETLLKIMEAKPSGIDYPEKDWQGEKLTAYNEFVKRLGRVPLEDKGAYLTEYMVGQAAENPPQEIDIAVWKEVQEHLAREVMLFGRASDWFSITGKLHQLITDQRSFNDDFVRRINDTYLHIDGNKAVSIGMDVCMNLAIRAIGTIKVYGPGMGALVSSLWIVTKSLLPDPSAKVNAAINELHNKVTEIFRHSLKSIETTDQMLAIDWGLLDQFGTLLESKELIWPRDLTLLRAAQSRAFHYVALQSTVQLMSHSHSISWLTIGVIDIQKKVNGKQDGRWSGNHYLTHSVYSKGGGCGCGKGWYLRELFLGYSVATSGSPQPTHSDAPANLQKKLFGTNIHNEEDPELGLTKGFLIYPDSKDRTGWNLKQLGFSG